jgi:hypothetical protein
MRFHAASVSASAAGDYYQLDFGPESTDEESADPFDVQGPYLLVQRQFEFADGGRCSIESHDESYIGEFHVRLVELSRTRLTFEILGRLDSEVEVSFNLSASEFEEFREVAEIVFGLKEPKFGGDDDAL